MTMNMDLVWREDGHIEYRSCCAKCSYRSELLDDEDAARASWFGHACVMSGTAVSV